MKNVNFLLSVTLLSFIIFLASSCKKDKDDPEPAPVDNKTTGTLSGVITNANDGSFLDAVQIVVFDASDNEPVGNALITDTSGGYTVELEAGSYYLRLFKQGYVNIPPPNLTPIAFEITANASLVKDFEMTPNNLTNIGIISGQALAAGSGVGGALIVASGVNSSASTITDEDGKYSIFNVEEGNYTIKAFKSNYNSDEVTATVTSGNEETGKDLTLTEGVQGEANGSVTFLATENGDIDIALTHPNTKETIPGLTTVSSGGNYTISNVPDGTYILRATFLNDTYVVDPDWIIKFGEPVVEIVGGNTVTTDFSVTGAANLVSPTNSSSSTEALKISETTPTFEWEAYSSASDYIIEIMDMNGNLIWGGFTVDGSNITKNIVIPKTQLSIVFNEDGNAAISELEVGQVYRWRIYVSKNDTQEPLGWKLISTSEDQQGLIEITE